MSLFGICLLNYRAAFHNDQRDHNMFGPDPVSLPPSERRVQKSVFRPPDSRTYYRTRPPFFQFRSKFQIRHRIFYTDIHKLAFRSLNNVVIIIPDDHDRIIRSLQKTGSDTSAHGLI